MFWDREELLERFKVEVVDVSNNTSLMKLFAVTLYPRIVKRDFTTSLSSSEVMQVRDLRRT